MEIRIAAAKTGKYASSESGDSLEVVERPNGGLSIVLADGQTSGKGAKSVSSLVVRKVVSLLADGVRDGAAARAASDALFTEKNGKVSSTLNILSVDTESNTIVITRNNPAPMLTVVGESFSDINDDCSPIGWHRNIRPSISELPIQPGVLIVMFTDGILHAGSRVGDSLDIRLIISNLLECGDPNPQEIADLILRSAMHLDNNRPDDDMSVVVLFVSKEDEKLIRRLSVELPL